MGDRLTDVDEEPQQTSPTPYGDIFDKVLPNYMAMGMTYDQFWDGEVGMKTAYREAYRIRIEQEQRIADRNNWLMGQYVVSALNAVPLLVAGLNVKRGSHIPEYPDKPFYDRLDADRKEEDRKKREEDQTKLALAMFQAGIEKFNRNLERRQEEAKKAESGQ